MPRHLWILVAFLALVQGQRTTFDYYDYEDIQLQQQPRRPQSQGQTNNNREVSRGRVPETDAGERPSQKTTTPVPILQQINEYDKPKEK